MIDSETGSRRSNILLVASLFVIICVGLMGEYQRITAKQIGYDFVPVYVASHAFWSGVNPYDDTRLKEHAAELLEDGIRPGSVGLPRCPFISPPSTLLILGPLCLLKFSHAWSLWSCINFMDT